MSQTRLPELDVDLIEQFEAVNLHERSNRRDSSEDEAFAFLPRSASESDLRTSSSSGVDSFSPSPAYSPRSLPGSPRGSSKPRSIMKRVSSSANMEQAKPQLKRSTSFTKAIKRVFTRKATSPTRVRFSKTMIWEFERPDGSA